MTTPTPALYTPRLVLMPLTVDDAAQIQMRFPQWEIVRFLDAVVPWPYPDDGALRWIEDIALPAVARGDAWHWTLRLRSTPDQVIGAISLMTRPGDNRGFWLGLPWQRQGLMTEAVTVVTDFWFNELKFDVLRVPKASANVASRRISEKTGMRLVGTGEKPYVSGRLPLERWEITAEEWNRRRAASIGPPTAAPELRTNRLLLRGWRPEDREPFAAMNADPEVMRYFPSCWTRTESDDAFETCQRRFEERGFSMWAVELTESRDFIGCVGLGVPRFEAPFTPCVEVGWRLARPFWNRGYATEAARAALRFGFETLKLHEIVAFTAVGNAPSRRVMEKLGMRRNPADDFDHPNVAPGHTLRRHVLYRLASRDFA